MNSEALNTLDYILNVYRTETHNSDDSFIDISLTIIAWNLFSNKPFYNKYQLKWENPSKVYYYEDILQNFQNNNSVEFIKKELSEWKKLNKDISVLWDITSVPLEEIHIGVWQNMLRYWGQLFALIEQTEQQEILLAVIDYLEKLITEEGRNENYLTPKEVSDVMVEYIRDSKPASIYDPFARSGNLLAAAAQIKTINIIQGATLVRLNQKLTCLRLLLVNISAETHIEHSFGANSMSVGFKKFDIILSNPPYGGSLPLNLDLNINEEWLDITRKLNRQDAAFLCHALSHLADKGQACMLLPTFFLSGNRVKELISRIISKNILDAVIQLPNGVFTNTPIAPVLFYFNKTRNEETKLFLIDASREFTKQGKQVSLNNITLSKWVNKIKSRDYSTEDNVVIVTSEQIKNKGFDLQPSSYKEKDSITRKPSEELLQECQALEKQIAKARSCILEFFSGK